VQQFRGGLAFKAHRLLNHPTIGLRVMKKKKKKKKEARLNRPGQDSGTGFFICKVKS
jgi:hypothetical protein